MVISLAEARRIALHAQGLSGVEAPFGGGKEGALGAVQHLGYVQIDTISVVQRAHHHVLWSRVPGYEPKLLHELHERDRTVFEYWHHAASYLPMRDYRFSLPSMRRYRRETHWADETPELKRAMRRMIGRIRRDGPLRLRDVEAKEMTPGWSDGTASKIEKRALHELCMRGQVMIRSREGFQKVFDLTERVVPEGIDLTLPSHGEAAEFQVRRALRALGVARAQELHYLQRAERAEAVRLSLRRLVRKGEVVEFTIAEFPGVPCYGLAESLERRQPLPQRRMHILSPFDNLVIQRERLRWLFGFDYLIECYVPAAKRRFGYFVLPLLWGDQFIGRMDAKADRANRRLQVHHLMWEKEAGAWHEMADELHVALDRFARFQGCDTVEVMKVSPPAAGRAVGIGGGSGS